MKNARTTALALTAVAALLATSGAAAADTGKPSPAQARTGDGAKALCKRVPKIEKRLQRALDRLGGGPAQRGSVNRLEKRAENARKAGHKEIETLLNDKLTFRRSLVPALEKRQKDLAPVKSWCKTHRDGAAK
ncbi:hypothetical protein ACFU5O_15100 [Streptomyces sp. NPDC057445]|uniref:hypothetical protein n=1 Tax=Streptomyces sp. NPDC057445 TaxID=3346136 RepID=UPI00368B78FB